MKKESSLILTSPSFDRGNQDDALFVRAIQSLGHHIYEEKHAHLIHTGTNLGPHKIRLAFRQKRL